MNFTVKKTIEVDVALSCDYTTAKPGIRTFTNGDPGFPDEPSEVDIISVSVGDVNITSELRKQNFDFDSLSEEALIEIENKLYEGGQDE